MNVKESGEQKREWGVKKESGEQERREGLESEGEREKQEREGEES